MSKYKQKSFSLWVLALAMPVAIVSLGFDSLEDPDYTHDSVGEPAHTQNISTLKRNVEHSSSGRGVDSEDMGSAAPSLKQDEATMDMDVKPEQAEKYGVQEYSIIVTEKGYFPNKVIVRRNIPVNLYLTATDSQNFCFVMKNGEYNFHRGVGSKRIEKISFKPMQAGPYKFHCPIQNIEGTLIVRD